MSNVNNIPSAAAPKIVHVYELDYSTTNDFDGTLETIAQADTGELYLQRTFEKKHIV